MTTDKSTANAKKDEGATKTTTAETAKPVGALGSAAARRAAEADAEDTREDAAANSKTSAEDGRDNIMFRGILMAIIMRLPPALAYGSHAKTLDDMMAFVTSFDTREERMVVVEMIKSVAEVAIHDLPSGAYRGRVEDAMRVVYGETEQVPDNIRDPHSSRAAADRLNLSLGGMPMPPEHAALEQKARTVNSLDATQEQKEAAARLYGSSAPS